MHTKLLRKKESKIGFSELWRARSLAGGDGYK